MTKSQAKLAPCDINKTQFTNPSSVLKLNKKKYFSVLQSTSELEKFRSNWERWQHFPNADIDFFLCIVNARKAHVSPYVIVIGDTDNPEAIVIARLEDGFVDIKFGYKKLFRIKIKMLIVMHNGILSEGKSETLSKIVSAVKDTLQTGVASMARFELLRHDSVFQKEIVRQISPLFREGFLSPQQHWVMSIPNTMDAFFATISGTHRYKIRKKIKNLEKDFPKPALKFRCFQQPDELEQMFADVETIAKTTYQRVLGAGFINNDENKNRLLLEAKRGWLRMHVLYLNDAPVSYWWCLHCEDIVYSCAMGYVPKYQEYSVGTYLIIKIIDNLCQAGNLAQIDFGPGDALYKQQFSNHSYLELSVNIFRQSFVGGLLSTSLTLNNGLASLAKRILKRLRLFDWIKKNWRQKLRSNNAAPDNG